MLGDLGANIVDDRGKLLLAGFLGLLLEFLDLRKVIAIAGHSGVCLIVWMLLGGSIRALAGLIRGAVAE